LVRELSPAAAGGECGAAHRLATVVMCKMYTIESPSRVRMTTSATALPHQRSACVTAPPLAAPWAHNIFAWRSPGSVSGTVPHRLPRDSHFSGHEAGLPHGVGGACACVAQDHIAAWTPWNCPMPRCVHQQSHPRRVDPDSIHPDRSATGAVWYIDLRHGMLTRLCCEVTRGIHVAWTG
jgi:Zn ribbon nucleic-acid-binding protein